MKNSFSKKSLALHKKRRGTIEIALKTPISQREDLNLVYTPGVGGVAEAIAHDPKTAYDYTGKWNSVAIVSDGSAVLGFGNLGPLPALPVMEGKSAIYKRFADIDAYPIVLATQNVEEIIAAVKAIAPTFGAIQLEDISAPRCFEIERRLQEELDIPVLHDDQHGTAIAVLAALINALRVVKKNKNVRIVINGAGAAGISITRLLSMYGFRNLTLLDSKGVISSARRDLTLPKKEILPLLNPVGEILSDAIRKADVCIGVSAPGVLTEDMVRSMNGNAIVFAMANPIPEIDPRLALRAGARIVATGRSDFPNQINNSLTYPGVFRGLLDHRIKKISPAMKIKVAETLASLVKRPTATNILPTMFDKRIVPTIARTLKP